MYDLAVARMDAYWLMVVLLTCDELCAPTTILEIEALAQRMHKLYKNSSEKRQPRNRETLVTLD